MACELCPKLANIIHGNVWNCAKTLYLIVQIVYTRDTAMLQIGYYCITGRMMLVKVWVFKVSLKS